MRGRTKHAVIDPLESRRLLSATAPAALAGKHVELFDADLPGGVIDLLAHGTTIIHSPDGQYESSGTYSYVRTGTAIGVLSFTFANYVGYGPYAETLSMTFSNNLVGSFRFEAGDGSFLLTDNSTPVAPRSINGFQLLCADYLGDVFKLRINAGGSYTLHVISGTYISDAAGSFTYTKTGTQTASISASGLGESTWSGDVQMYGRKTGTFGLGDPYGDSGISGVFSIASANAGGSRQPVARPGPLKGSIIGRIAPTAKAGDVGTTEVRLTNANGFPVSGPYTVAVALGVISPDGSLGQQTPLAHVVLPGPFKPGSKQIQLTFRYDVAPGPYKLIVAGGPASNDWGWIRVAPTPTIVG